MKKRIVPVLLTAIVPVLFLGADQRIKNAYLPPPLSFETNTASRASVRTAASNQVDRASETTEFITRNNLSLVNVVENEYAMPLSKTFMFDEAWTSRGQEGGELSWPQGLAYSETNAHLIVADTWNQQIQVLDLAGNYLFSWGSYGSGLGEFYNLSEAAVASDGTVYVVDTGNNRIQVFDPTGGCLAAWGEYGQGNGQFNYPYSIATTPEGFVVVGDLGNCRIQVFEEDGTFVANWGEYGDGDGCFECPYGVAATTGGQVVVVDPVLQRVEVFDLQGNFIRKWGVPGSEPGKLNCPARVKVSADNRVYLTDSQNARLQVFSLQGDYLYSYNGPNCGWPFGLTVSPEGNAVYYTDLAEHLVVAISPPDNDGDGMYDWYELFFGLDPENPDDWTVQGDADELNNFQESRLWTDPGIADTDRDGFDDSNDSNALSRAYIEWGNPSYTFGDRYLYPGPLWWTGAYKINGDFSNELPYGWHAAPIPFTPTNMVQVPGGTMEIDEPDYGAYGFTCADFYIDRTEVTKAKWDQVREWAASNGYDDLPEGSAKGTNHPVCNVNCTAVP